jgi:hypothetical protein
LATVVFTTGAPGSGKSCLLVQEVYKYLVEENGVFISNLPIKKEEMIDYVCEQHPDMVRGRLEERIKLFKTEITKPWLDEQMGPWEVFQTWNIDLCGAWIVIDEIHNYCPSESKKDSPWIKEWGRWLGELRHQGCRIEFVTQHPKKVASPIATHAGIRREIINHADERGPFGIINDDWFEMFAAFRGNYLTSSKITELMEKNGKWVEQHTALYPLCMPWFGLYDSYSAPIAGGKAGRPKRKHEYLTRYEVIKWFIRKNWSRFIFNKTVIIFMVIIVGFMGLGNLGKLVNWAMPSNSTEKPTTEGSKKSIAKESGKTATDLNHDLKVTDKEIEGSDDIKEYQIRLEEKDKHLKVMVENYDGLKVQIKEIMDKQEKYIREQKEGAALVVIGRDYITLRNGTTYYIDDVIDDGIYVGKKLASIDREKRKAVLNDGTILRMEMMPSVSHNK